MLRPQTFPVLARPSYLCHSGKFLNILILFSHSLTLQWMFMSESNKKLLEMCGKQIYSRNVTILLHVIYYKYYK